MLVFEFTKASILFLDAISVPMKRLQCFSFCYLFLSSCSFFAKKNSAFQNSFTHLPFFCLRFSVFHFPPLRFISHDCFLFFQLAPIFPFLPLSLILFSSLYLFSLIVCLSFSVTLSLSFDFFFSPNELRMRNLSLALWISPSLLHYLLEFRLDVSSSFSFTPHFCLSFSFHSFLVFLIHFLFSIFPYFF